MLQIARSTLVDLSKASIGIILESLVGLLEELARPYSAVSDHPSHVLSSELFVLRLAADCCSANWSAPPNAPAGAPTVAVVLSAASTCPGAAFSVEAVSIPPPALPTPPDTGVAEATGPDGTANGTCTGAGARARRSTPLPEDTPVSPCTS